MKKVVVLISTYNGEKYLEDQINSLLNQQGIDVEILARDDGSSDNTINILSKYAMKYSSFSFYSGNNVKSAQSFLDLVVKAKDADFYAFCDQDDVWEDDKLLIAVEKIEKLDQSKPALYYSNLKIVDKDLNVHRLSHTRKMYNSNKYSVLTENLCTGCTAVFNKKAKEIISLKLPNYCTMHDAWLYMVCMLMGNCVYDEAAHIMYRQHEKNVVGTYLEKNKYKILKKRMLRLFDKNLQPRYMNAVNFYDCFADILEKEDKEKLLLIINYKSSIRKRMELFFDQDIRPSTFYENLRFRLHILWGTV